MWMRYFNATQFAILVNDLPAQVEVAVPGLYIIRAISIRRIPTAVQKGRGNVTSGSMHSCLRVSTVPGTEMAGSDPTDMDGNSPLVAGRNDSFLQLATALRQEGVTVVRYDNRTAGKSADTVPQRDEMDFDVFVEDCRDVIAWNPSVSCRGVRQRSSLAVSGIDARWCCQAPIPGIATRSSMSHH